MYLSNSNLNFKQKEKNVHFIEIIEYTWADRQRVQCILETVPTAPLHYLLWLLRNA